MDERDANNQNNLEYLRELAESLVSPVDLDICTYEVSGTTTAHVKLLCSKNIDEVDAEWLIKVFVWHISSSFCSVSEDDLEFEWINCTEILKPGEGLDYLQNAEVEGEVFFSSISKLSWELPSAVKERKLHPNVF